MLGNYKNIYLKDDINATEGNLVEKSQIIYAKKGNLINKNTERYLELFDGQILNSDGTKIKSFTFKKVNFNLAFGIILYMYLSQKFKKHQVQFYLNV